MNFSYLVAAILFIFVPPIAGHWLPKQQEAIVAIHEFISAMVVSTLFFARLRRKFRFEYFCYAVAFLCLAIADLVWGWTSEIVLNTHSLFPSTIIREFAYTGFGVLLAVGIFYTYRSSLHKMNLAAVSIMTLAFFWIGFRYINLALYEKPDHSLVYDLSGSIYNIGRAFALALAVQMMIFEKKFLRFLFLYAVAQMFACDLALNFELSALDAVHTPLHNWFGSGWHTSGALFCVLALYQRKSPFPFGESVTASLKSVRALTPILATSVMLIQGAGFWFFGFLHPTNLMEMMHYVSLGFAGLVLSNIAGILMSNEITRVRELDETQELRSDKRVFFLEENQRTFFHLLSLQRKLDEQKWLVKVGEFASQLAHDIRSPLAALNMMVGSTKELPEEKRLTIRNAAQRINDIANGLLKHSKKQTNALHAESAESADPVMLVALVDAIISEKRIQYREHMEIEIQGELSAGYGVFAKINATELARVISNLIDNSVQAFEEAGRVLVSVRSEAGRALITVEDNGKGIPAEILPQIGERGFSQGKEHSDAGAGLGVSHARETLERVGGRLAVSSQVGLGTTITLNLPRCESPTWFMERLRLRAGELVVSVDDDQTIHQIWSGRLAAAIFQGQAVPHLKFTSLEQFENWFHENPDSDCRILIDYEFLGQAGNGLATIAHLGIADRAVLVTSRFENPRILAKGAELNLKILPKGLAPFIPIEIVNPKRLRYDALLIDDDETIVHTTWQIAARESGKNIKCFVSPEDFFLVADEIDPETPVYIDVNLGKGVRGEEVAVKAHARGFPKIYLATGYDPETIQAPDCVRAVVGKSPVFC